MCQGANPAKRGPAGQSRPGPNSLGANHDHAWLGAGPCLASACLCLARTCPMPDQDLPMPDLTCPCLAMTCPSLARIALARRGPTWSGKGRGADPPGADAGSVRRGPTWTGSGGPDEVEAGNRMDRVASSCPGLAQPGVALAWRSRDRTGPDIAHPNQPFARRSSAMRMSSALARLGQQSLARHGHHFMHGRHQWCRRQTSLTVRRSRPEPGRVTIPARRGRDVKGAGGRYTPPTGRPAHRGGERYLPRPSPFATSAWCLMVGSHRRRCIGAAST